jgi:hypothetical protein
MSEAGAAAAGEYQMIGPSEDGRISNLLENLSPKESRQRLQALISEWLRMENLVVLTGAGSSVSSGGKTLEGLEKAVLETVRALPSSPSDLKPILDMRLDAENSGEARIGFEDWLSYLVNAHALTTVRGSPFASVEWRDAPKVSGEDLAWGVEWITKAIFAECALALPEPTLAAGPTTISPHLAFLAKLVARDSNLGRANVFTLNYDTLFEQALELLGIQYFDGFTGRADARFDASVYGLDIYYPGEVAEGRVSSIHWRVLNDELCARHADLSQFADYRGMKVADKAARLHSIAASVPTAGILPTANKFAQTLTMPFAHLFRSLQIRLSAPQTFLLVLGYGFGDEHVTRLLETALMNPSLVMLVVEPNPESPIIERVKRYKDLGKRAFVLTASAESFAAKPFNVATFDDFARGIMPDVQWLDDFLRLRRFERQIRASGLAAGQDELRAE